MTEGVVKQTTDVDRAKALEQHGQGDWGDVDPETKKMNDVAMFNGGSVLSVYKSAAGVVFWIITDWGGETSTILLPGDY